MKASVRWLRALIPGLSLSPQEIGKRLTSVGLEVEGIHAFGEGIETCVIASVVSLRPHPTKSGLRLVTIDAGKTLGTIEVVCGAPNVPEAGGKVVFAPLGTRLPAKGLVIAERDIGGVKSIGMLCSEAELGIGEGSGGIMILESGEAGQKFVDAFPEAQDHILELGLTPNRPDGLGHFGLARELAAILSLPAPRVSEKVVSETVGSSVRVASAVDLSIEDPRRCPHYGAFIAEGLTVAPSPLGTQCRLIALGIRPISNVVDWTNLAMMLFGHPMHAFDLDRVRGGTITVRLAKKGEKLETIDHIVRELTDDDLVIADGEGPVALAGVMGGAGSEITTATKRAFFEVAMFDARTVRRSSRRHAIHTESSHRFERGIDHGDTGKVLTATLEAVLALGGKPLEAPGILVATKLPLPEVRLRHSRMEALLGMPVEMDLAKGILERLGCTLVSRTKEGGDDVCVFRAPSHRPDLSREEDLIEEVMRMVGIDSVPSVVPMLRPPALRSTSDAAKRIIRDASVNIGLSEALTYGFTSPAVLAKVSAPVATVILQNPLSVEQSVMRTSVLPGVLEAIGRAKRHGEGNARLFTTGVVFHADGKALPREEMHYAAALSGDRATYLGKPESVDVLEATGVAVALVDRVLHKNVQITPFPTATAPAHLHPRGAAQLLVDGEVVGTLGPLHPDVLESMDLPPTVVVEFNIEKLLARGVRPAKFQAIPRFPASPRDLAVVVETRVRAGDVEAAVREAGGELVEDVSLFDRFTGGAITEGHVSLAFHVVYRSAEKTLKDDEVDQKHRAVVDAVKSRFGAALR